MEFKSTALAVYLSCRIVGSFLNKLQWNLTVTPTRGPTHTPIHICTHTVPKQPVNSLLERGPTHTPIHICTHKVPKQPVNSLLERGPTHMHALSQNNLLCNKTYTHSHTLCSHTVFYDYLSINPTNVRPAH